MMRCSLLLTVVLWATVFTTTSYAQDAPVAVTCDLEVYALCAYANCTINGDLQTATCPCLELSGPSVARIDLIPDPVVQQETLASPDNTSTGICRALADKSLWAGADAVSTFSRASEVENNVTVNEDGTRGDPTWSCSGVEGRMVPNCMLAPCRALGTVVTNPYYSGEATMECVCPLIAANIDYTNFGGLQDPCQDSMVPVEGGYAQNAGGALLNQYVMDQEAVAAAWDAVEKQFSAVVETGAETEPPSRATMEITVWISFVVGFVTAYSLA